MALTQENILGSFLPTVNVSKIILNNSKVDLELVVIDTEADEGIFSIINDKFLRDCITIKIFQSLDPDKTERLLNFEENFDYIDIPITNTTKFDIDEDGNRKLYYNASFEINTLDLNHLAYIVYSDIDVQALRNSFQIILTPEELKDIPRKINADIVIEEQKIVSTSYIYQLPDGSIWAGEVINLNGIYQTLEENSRVLEEIQIPNYKIQDFRLRNIIQKNSVSEEFIKYSDILIEDSFIPQANLDIIVSKPRIFENVIKYSNRDKSVSISILVDLNQLIKQNCLYPKILPKTLNEDNLISNMSLYKRKIKSFTKNDNKILIEVDEQKEPELILNNFKNFKLKINDDSAHYLLTDQKMKYISEGVYQYGVQVNFLDPTIVELKKRLIKVLSVRKNMVEYLTFCEAFTDSQTNSFQKEVVETWDVDEIDRNAEAYFEAEINLPPDLNKKQLLDSLKSNISPINGTLDGIYLFLKIIDDLIGDISNLLSITNTTSDIYEFNESDLETFSIKSSVEFFKYFNETIHDSELYNKVEVSYFDITNGIVDASQFSKRIFPTTTANNPIYVSPKSVTLINKKIELSSVERESSETIRKQKYLLLNNNIKNIQQNNSLYVEQEKIKYITERITEKSRMYDNLIKNRDILIQNNISTENSVIIENEPNGSENYNKFLSLENIIEPQNQITIAANSTDAVMLKDLTLDVSDDEDIFKYLMLTKVEYSYYNENLKKLIWRNLTLQTITGLINDNKLNILCKLIPYDYSSLSGMEIKNINKFNFSNYFILNLSNFNFTTETVQQTEEAIAQNISVQSVAPQPEPSTPPQTLIVERPIRLRPTILPTNLKPPPSDLKNLISTKPTNSIRDVFEIKNPPSKLPKNNISKTNVAVSVTRPSRQKNNTVRTTNKNTLNNLRNR